MPDALVVASHACAPSTRCTEAPAIGVSEGSDRSVNSAASTADVPAMPLVTLGLRVSAVTCLPLDHDTTDSLEVTVVAPFCARATILSTPIRFPTYVSVA